MMDPPSKYTSRKASAEIQTALRKAALKTLPFAKVDVDTIAAIAREFDPALALMIEFRRLSGLRRVQRREGWLALTQELLARVALTDRDCRGRALRRLIKKGVLEVRRLNAYGNKLEYRLNPNWAKPEAEVVDLAPVKQAKPERRLRP